MSISTISNNLKKIKEPRTLLNRIYDLNSDGIIMYTIFLPNYIDIIPDLGLFLNPEEIVRAQRFHMKKDKNRFIICRSILKIVLAAYSYSNVNSINIEYHSNKKPFLRTHSNLFFNVSHSEDFAIIVISNSEVGIDVEYISKDFEYTELFTDVFHDDEIAVIQSADDKKLAFYTFWTRKEAFVKALGKGIDDSFKQIPCLAGNHIFDLNITKSKANWQVNSFELAKNYICSVAHDSDFDSKKMKILNLPNTVNALLKLTQIKEV